MVVVRMDGAPDVVRKLRCTWNHPWRCLLFVVGYGGYLYFLSKWQ